jgi:hypothetical protein
MLGGQHDRQAEDKPDQAAKMRVHVKVPKICCSEQKKGNRE